MSNGPRVRGGGTIGIVGSELARYSDFQLSLFILVKPPDTRIIQTKTSDVVGNCNQICRNMRGEWVWLLGDDGVCNPDALVRLLENDVDIVVPLIFTKTPPYKPVVMAGPSGIDEHGHLEYRVEHDLPEHGLHEVYAAGSHGMLIKRWVLDAIGDPWFATDGRGLNEDFSFCAKARDAGAHLFVDVDVPFGHIAPHTVWPDYRDGGWHPNLILNPETVLPLKNQVVGT